MVELFKNGLLLTKSPSDAASYLDKNCTVVMPFVISPSRQIPTGMLGWFGPSTHNGLNELARVKGREKKPFVDSCPPSDIQLMIYENRFIHNDFPIETRDKIVKFLASISKTHPIGVLLPASNEAIAESVLTEGLRVGSTNIRGKKITTYGIMVCGPGDRYPAVLDCLDRNRILATSLNVAGDSLSRGSGHRFFNEVVKDFRHNVPKDSEIAVLVPKKYRHGNGVSTTVVVVGENGEMWLNREGSLPEAEVKIHVENAGLQYCGEVDGGKKIIDSYSYPSNGNLSRVLLEMLLIRYVNICGRIHVSHK